VAAVSDHYENQSDEEAFAEDETIRRREEKLRRPS